VIAYPFATRFYYLKHPPVPASACDSLPDLVDKSRTYPHALEECVEANDRYHQLVIETIEGLTR
jgi:hypothetical protein